MSIIEKALDKSDDNGERTLKPVRSKKTLVEHESSVADGQPKARAAEAPSEQAPLPELTDVHPAPLEAERIAASRNSPDIPRQTTKKIAVDLARLDAAGIITPESGRMGLVEQFRIIKRPILMKASHLSESRVPNGNIILVTSAVAGEGKTFTAVNIAMSVAMELDHTVLLIDADVVKSDVSRLLGIEESEGLTDFLAQPKRALSEFLVETDVSNLSVLPSGRPRANVTELFASDQMRRLLDELGRRYTNRVVIIDSPPLLGASGASVLTHMAGQTVFVVEAIRTSLSAVEEALGLLKGVRNVGVVLNKSRSKGGLGYEYGSYYAPTGDNR